MKPIKKGHLEALSTKRRHIISAGAVIDSMVRDGVCTAQVQAAMVGELYRLAEKSQKQVQKPTGQGRLLQWYFFLVTAFWMYFRWVRADSPVEMWGMSPFWRLALLLAWI